MCMVSLPCDVCREYIDRAFCCSTSFSGMRGEDCEHCYCDQTQIINADAKMPRRFKWILDRTKGDPMGTGPIANRYDTTIM